MSQSPINSATEVADQPPSDWADSPFSRADSSHTRADSSLSRADAPATEPSASNRAQRVVRVLRTIWLDLLALVWPTQCVVCEAPDRDLCDDCRDHTRQAEGRVQKVHTAAGEACVAGPFAGPLRAVLVAYKHADMTGFVRVLGAQLRAPLRATLNTTRPLGVAPALIVTVPSRPQRVRERGFRHVDLLVRAALRAPPPKLQRLTSRWSACRGRRFVDPLVTKNHQSAERDLDASRAYLVPRALRTLRGRTTQVGLSSAERQRNAALVTVPLVMRSRLRDRDVVLVDDVITTGATMLAAARALEKAGARVVGMVALCATERRDTPSTHPNR